MSAFVVEDTTINEVVTFVFTDHLHIGPALCRKLKSVEIDTEEQLGAAMMALNYEGVDARYGVGETAEYGGTYAYAWTPTTQIQALKSLRCWLYQCHEGTVAESQLYALMEQCAHDLAYEIVSNLPEWKAAHWA